MDGLRAVAILGVVGFHAGVPGFANGSAGVTVFFVLSGYLITSLLAKQTLDGRSILLFYLRRLLRLYPALLVVLVACVAYAFMFLHAEARSELLREVLSAGLYVEDVVLASQDQISDWGLLGHTWSLAVEEQFYLVWPLVLLVALRLPRRSAIALVGLLTVAAVAWRTLLSGRHLPYRVGVGDGNAEALLVGCLLALLLAEGVPPRARQLLIVPSGVGLALLLVIYTGLLQLPLDLMRLVCALVTALVITGLRVGPDSLLARSLGLKPMVVVGMLSYGLYLWHPVVFGIFADHVSMTGLRDKIAWAPAMLAVTAAFTVGSYCLVEKPFNALKDRLPR